LRWSNEQFWSATLTEFFAAFDFWCEANGVKTGGEGMTRERNEELKRLYG